MNEESYKSAAQPFGGSFFVRGIVQKRCEPLRQTLFCTRNRTKTLRNHSGGAVLYEESYKITAEPLGRRCFVRGIVQKCCTTLRRALFVREIVQSASLPLRWALSGQSLTSNIDKERACLCLPDQPPQLYRTAFWRVPGPADQCPFPPPHPGQCPYP